MCGSRSAAAAAPPPQNRGGFFSSLGLPGVDRFFNNAASAFNKGLDIANKLTGFNLRTMQFEESNQPTEDQPAPESGGLDTGMLLILGGLALAVVLLMRK